MHHNCGQRFSADKTALYQPIRQKKGDHDRSYATEECRKETEYSAQDSKTTQGNAQGATFTDVACQDSHDKKETKKPNEESDGRRGEEKSADERGRHAAEGKPTYDRQLKLMAVKPDAANIPNQLRYSQNRDCVAHTKHGDQNRQKYRGASKTSDGCYRGRHKRATPQ